MKMDLAMQTATQAGAQATQVATWAAALWGLGMAAAASFTTCIIGIFLGITINTSK